jgi:ComF family protein
MRIAETGRALLDLLLPPACLGCRSAIAPRDTARFVCRRCRSRLLPPPAPLCARCGAPCLRTGRAPELPCALCRDWPADVRVARSACLLVPPADALVHQLKYRGWHRLAEPLAERMAAVALPADVVEEAKLCVPVPTTAARHRERGYNQAERLATAFARRTGRTPIEALVRARGNASQIALQPAARGANVAHAFAVVPDVARTLRRAHVLLVDDVMTTGATAVACAAALVDGGARCVSVLTFARAVTAPGLNR